MDYFYQKYHTSYSTNVHKIFPIQIYFIFIYWIYPPHSYFLPLSQSPKISQQKMFNCFFHFDCSNEQLSINYCVLFRLMVSFLDKIFFFFAGLWSLLVFQNNLNLLLLFEFRSLSARNVFKYRVYLYLFLTSTPPDISPYFFYFNSIKVVR